MAGKKGKSGIYNGNKGHKMPEHVRLMLIEINTGKHRSEETKQKLREVLTGKKRSPEIRAKMSIAQKGRIVTAETRAKIGQRHKGKVTSEATKLKMSLAKKGKKQPISVYGKNHWNWIEDRNSLKRYNGTEEKRSPIYKRWRKEVCDRDGWKCKINNTECNGRLEVHHILGFTEHPELRYDANNGICLCHAHHPRKRAEEKRLSPYFQDLVSVSNN